MKTITTLMLCLFALSGCAGGPDNGGERPTMRLGDAVQSVEEIVTFYAFSARDMKIDISPRNVAILRWFDQLHDRHNKMSWVPRKHSFAIGDKISRISRDKNGFKIVIKGGDGECFFIAENEQRAQQLRHALHSIQKRLEAQAK